MILILCSATHGKLFSINEEVQREALKEFYERFYHMKYVYSKDANLLLSMKVDSVCLSQNIIFEYFVSSKAEEQGKKTERRLRRATIVAHYISPIVAVTFAVVYWVIGMFNVMYPSMQQEM